MFWLLATMACGFEPMDTGTDTGTDTVDRGDPVDVIVYPTAGMKRVLLYHGHGGQELKPRGGIVETWRAEGWEVRPDDQFPSDLKPFRLIVFTAAGTDSSTPFTEGQIISLTSALERGTRLVFLQEDSKCVTDNVSALLDALAIPMAFDQPLPTSTPAPQSFSTVAADTQLMSDVAAMSLADPCGLTVGGSWMLRSDDSVPLVSAYRPGTGGDVVLIGDTDFLKDGALYEDQNLIFAQNLAKVLP